MTDPASTPAAAPGQRDRIRQPAPPAPIPAPRAPRRSERTPDLSRPPAETQTVATNNNGVASDAEVVRSTGSMAIATLISRITGFLRSVLIGAVLGPAVASAFHTANTLPNLITEIVLGAVLTSLVVPVLVRAEKEDPDRGEAFIRRLLTVALTLLLVVTVLAVAAAPILTRINLAADGEVNVGMATAFAFLLLPQIIFYGVFSLLMAVLNTKGVFKPGAWAPVANNVVAIATLMLYFIVPGRLDPNAQVSLTDPHILLLGIGTTLGVVVQALIMVPPLLKAGVNLRPLWGIDDRVKRFAGMGVAIVTYVAISQLGYVVTNRIASVADDAAVTIYQQSWLLLQVPYGIIGVTLLTAIMPRLSRNASEGDDEAVVRDLSVGTRLTMIALIPVVVFFTGFGQQIANALFAYGLFTKDTADILGWTLSFSAFTLIPYALVLLHLRVFYAREEAWTPTMIITGITVVKVLLSVLAPVIAIEPERVVVLLGAANGFGFVAGAIIGVVLLRRTLGRLGGRQALTTCLWAFGASLMAVVVAILLDRLIEMTGVVDPLGSVGYLVRVAISGLLFLLLTGLILMRSPLSEVATVAGALSRVPGVNRLVKKSATEPGQLAEVDARAAAADVAGESAAMGADGIIASPLLPPLPTEAARPIRFVPGERIRNGRFRLVSEEATVPAMRFWRAVEYTGPGETDKREVGLVFVDPQALATDGLTAAEASREVAAASRRLRGVAGVGVAPVIDVLVNRVEIIVVTEWVPGAPLTKVVSRTPNPEAAALAASGLFQGLERAHNESTVLGLDAVERLRVDEHGSVVLAFPAPRPGATVATDSASAATALHHLLGDCPEVPEAISEAAEAAATDDPGVVAKRLRDAAYGSDNAMAVEPEAARRSGSTGPLAPVRHTSNWRLWSIGGGIVALVLVAAIVVVAAFAIFNSDDTSPVDSDSVKRGPGAVSDAITEAVTIKDAREWQAPNDDPLAGPDNPDDAVLVFDNNPTTAWSTSVYSAQFGTTAQDFKPGVGVVLEFAGPVRPGEISILGSPGAVVQIRALNKPDAVDPQSLALLGQATLVTGPTDIELEGAPASRYLLVWVSQLPMPNAASVAEVSVTRR
ncbi:murein biosynthesis integral membrane protein MurJ [Corynebacterium sp. TAE3-ERU12]|uniref:murein biosynthesis integral membrane protein MurJ n=1 Tax=Corynebacterium sp. TAE3-ERU12 TaxID=2849491 RepID=UPI001C4545A3|nr:murein biosynthesis integral membrane protein MurJ [Corynebacterium sp. TAE3-ERU12]